MPAPDALTGYHQPGGLQRTESYVLSVPEADQARIRRRQLPVRWCILTCRVQRVRKGIHRLKAFVRTFILNADSMVECVVGEEVEKEYFCVL